MALCAILLVLAALGTPGFGNAQEIASGATLYPARLNPVPPANIPKEISGRAKAESSKPGVITDVAVQPENGKLIITISTDRLLAPYEFLVENPPRLVLDFPNTENRVPFTRKAVNAASVKRLRVQQFQGLPNMIARVVFDLSADFVAHAVTLDKSFVRIVFDPSAAKSGAAAVHPQDKATVTYDTPSLLPRAPYKPEAPKTDPPKAPSAAQADPEDKPAVKRDTSSLPPPVPYKPEAPKNDPPKAASAQSNSEDKLAVKRDTASLPPPVPYKPEASKTDTPKTASAVDNSKPRSAEAPTPVSPNSSGVQQIQVSPRADLSKITVELPSRETPPAAPLVAALAPPSAATFPKTYSFPDSRFSGHPLTLDLVDVSLVDFFRLMAEEGGINIVMDPGIKGTISIKVVKVPWDQIFEAALANNGLDKKVEGSLVRIARKSTLQEEAKQEEALKKANLLAADLETRIKRLNYAKAEALVDALADQKTVRGTVVVDERTNSLILTDVPSSLDRLVRLIESLDIPQPQVEIEARIVSATRDFARDIGIQFGFVQGNLQRVTVGGPNTFGTIGGTRPSATPKSTYAAGNPFTGRGASESDTTESAAVSTGTSTQNKGNYNVNLPATKAFGGLGISIGNIFDTFLLDAAITAGEAKGLAKLISQPKVVAQNNSQAVITQGLRFPVQIVANNTVTVQFQNAALTLTVTPQITYEGNIVLDLKVENNTPDFSNQVNNIPSIRTSESTTRVLVSDGGTTVIGGILMDDEANHEDKVPGLGSLPLVGNLFRRTSVSRTTTEVLFFVTPRIVK